MICGIFINAIYLYDETKNTHNIYTADFMQEKYTKELIEEIEIPEYDKISDEYKNKKAIAYNMIIVSKGDKSGIINLKKESIIGLKKYKTLLFDEATRQFIVKTTNDKMGIINISGVGKIDFLYDNIKIINYSPLLYQVEMNGKYGIIDEKGNIIINYEYDLIGYPGDPLNNTEAISIIDTKKDEKLIIVQKNKKYGLINIDTKVLVLDFIADKIYEDSTSKENQIKFRLNISRNDI